jgi:hypothetical protein
MRHQSLPLHADDPAAMDVKEITFEDLLAGESASVASPTSFEQLLADGFPHKGGLEGLAAILRMEHPGPRFVAVRQSYLQILQMQMRRTR